ncbi:sensor domain-containing protein, partial [Galactobacter sp.]|uniref:sensor domain-containing protein n=1 Tax=Galactobacter sp. TaxID=2676125 RepID=UPI0025C4F50E
EAPAKGPRRPSPYNLRALLRDYGFVMPGFFLSVASFCLLITMLSASAGLILVWVGIVLLPATLWLASAFADLNRARLRWWGKPVARPGLALRKPGIRGFIGLLTEPRRWLDLVYQTIVAFPIHVFTFSVAVAWTASALGGLTEVFWLRFIPGFDEGPYAAGYVVDFVTLGSVPESVAHSLWMSYVVDFVVAVIMLALLPLVMRGLAMFDAAVMGAALGGTVRSGHQDGAVAPSAGSPAASFGTATRSRDGQETQVSATGWSWIAASAFSAALVGVSWPLLTTTYEIHVVFAMLLAFGLAAMMLLAVTNRVTWTLGVVIGAAGSAVAAILGVGADGIASRGLPWPWPAFTIVAVAFTCLLGALRHHWLWAVIGWAVLQVPTVLVGLFWSRPLGSRMDLVMTDLIVAAAVSLATLLIGLGLRALFASRTALNRERRASAELSAEREELDERTRIARELHDVVAHSMSVISVQATTAPYRLPQVDQPTKEEFASIADSSRQALAEMRSLLTLLRTPTDGTQPELAPQATLSQIPDLIEATRASGATINVQLSPLSDDLVTPAAGLATYRIVQEGLSNAVRHSPGATIDVTVNVTDAAVEIAVENGPATAEESPAAPGAGLGLAGVRERAQAVGGQATATATEDGGFRLRATLPR